MIDYDKLKEAMEMAQRLPYPLMLKISTALDECWFELTFMHSGDDEVEPMVKNTQDLDLIIGTMEKITPQPKYKKGEHVYWVGNHSLMSEGEIVDIVWEGKDKGFWCQTKHVYFPQDSFYKSRKDLIADEIKMWSARAEEEND